MKASQRMRNRYNGLAAIVFFVIAFFTIAFTVLLSLRPHYDNEGITEAVVTRIVINHYDGDQSEAYITYEVNDIKYEDCRSDFYSSSMKVGDIVQLRYNIDDPSEFYVDALHEMWYVFIIGIGFNLIAVVMLILSKKAIKKQKLILAEQKRKNQMLDDERFSFEYNDYGSKKEYVFFPQSGKEFVLCDNSTKTTVYKAELVKAKFLVPSDYEFKNIISGRKYNYKIGSPITNHVNGIATYSYFSFEGQNIWDYLEGKNISIRTTGNFPFYSYEVFKNKKVIATINHSQGPTKSDLEMSFMKYLSLSVSTYEECLDDIFLVLFAMSRTSMIKYDF